MSEPGLISVIVPALDEERWIDSCLESLDGQEGPIEVIVADGGSRDATHALVCSRPGVRVVESPAGRACQLNAGVRAARGEILWFVHADCLAPAGAARAIRHALGDGRTSLGAFRFALDGRRRSLRAVEWMVRFRSERFGLPYGDQGLFMTRGVFDAAGGFPQEPILEDLMLVRAAKRLGRVRVLDREMITSSRRWEDRGVLRTLARNWSIIILDRLGASPSWLARKRWVGAPASLSRATPVAGDPTEMAVD